MSIADVSNQILDFVRANPNGSAAVVFFLAFGESLAFVSLVLPFWAILVGIGTVIGGASPVIFWTIVTAAACGAALGDWLSYWIGYHYHEKVREMWPLNKNPGLIDKGHVFFEKWGPWAIVLARFSGPLRASVPIAAGIAEMPFWRFQIANWASAFLWAFVLLSPGSWGLQWWLDKFK